MRNIMNRKNHSKTQCKGVSLHNTSSPLNSLWDRLVVTIEFTYHLQSSKVLFPPEIFPHMRAHRWEHVVTVHDYMHEGIEQAEERGMTPRGEFDSKPHGHGHHAVVNHVQSWYVIEFLSQHKEDLHRNWSIKHLY